MFNIFQLKHNPFTTYLDVSTSKLMTVANQDYTRKLWQVQDELMPYSDAIWVPSIKDDHLHWEYISPQEGVKLCRHTNLEALLANNTLSREFIFSTVPKLLKRIKELDKPPEVVQDPKLVAAYNQAKGHIQDLAEAIKEHSDLNSQLLERINELESMLGDKWQDIKVIIQKFSDVNVRVQFLENFSEGHTHTYVFKNIGLQVDDAKIKRVCDSIPALLNWVSDPPSYEVSRGEITLEFDTRDIESQIDDLQTEWLPEVACSESNLMVFGARGSGKTTLVNNYIAATLNNIPDAQVEYLQPKPEPDTIVGIIPTAVGFEKSFERHEWLMEEYMRRNDLNVKASEQGKPFPQFSPIFAIYEEFQAMVAKAPNAKKLCKDLETAVIFGRTLGLNFLVTAQVASIRNFPGWTKASLTQYNRLYIGEAIKTALDYAPSATNKAEIRDQYKLYLASNREYYGLLSTVEGKNHIYDLPLPETYNFEYEVEPKATVKCNRRDYEINIANNADLRPLIKDSVLTCPDCGSTTWIPHKYLSKPGETVHLRCADKTCKCRLKIKI